MASPQFPYNNAVPQATQKIASTQQSILNNFQAINELISTNHVGFSDVVNYGKHTFTTFPAQSPAPVTVGNQMSLYAAAATTTNGIELFYQYPNGGTTNQLTGSASVGGTSGYSLIPGGIIMKWGLATGMVAGANVITFPTTAGFPAFTTSIFNVGFSTASNYTISYNGPYISAQTLLNFTLTVPSTISSNVYWFAIGI